MDHDNREHRRVAKEKDIDTRKGSVDDGKGYLVNPFGKGRKKRSIPDTNYLILILHQLI